MLGARFVVAQTFDAAGFERFVRQSAPAPSVETAPEGRLLSGAPPEHPLEQVTRLVAALAPFTPDYPMPHFRIAGRSSR